MPEKKLAEWTVVKSKVETKERKFRVQVPKIVRQTLEWKDSFGPGSLFMAWVNPGIDQCAVLTNLDDPQIKQLQNALKNFNFRGYL